MQELLLVITIKNSMMVLDNEEKALIALMHGKISLWVDTPMVLSD